MPSKPDGTSLTTATSTRLLEGLKQAEDGTIWRQFDQRYRPLLLNYARRLGLAGADAEDATQQSLIAFCTAYQQGKYDRDKGRLRSWLFGIARRQIKRAIRRRYDGQMQVHAHTDQTSFFAQIADEDRWEAMWEEQWQQAVLAECLREVRTQFDAKTIQAFELFAWKGLSAKQVARDLGISENAVFLAKHRILKRVRELLPGVEEIF